MCVYIFLLCIDDHELDEIFNESKPVRRNFSRIYYEFVVYFQCRNTSDPLSKQSSITSISSNIPLMATNSDSQYSAHLLANTATDVQSFLDSLKTNTSTIEYEIIC